MKAAAGGGGRGMRVVRSRPSSPRRSRRRSARRRPAFGDDRVFLERYLERPRHVEVQLLADAHGTVLALGERECSVQRRHQKVLEESPVAGARRRRSARELSDAAVRFAEAIGYVGAGTAEFVVDGREFFFLELNARIQVEHPVTEAVTGLDLVQWQLRIARGERLDARARADGHAVEVRLYAEDPRTFLPQAGRIERLRLPDVGPGRRAASPRATRSARSYDPMIAKLIAHGDDARRGARPARARRCRDRGRRA